MVTLMRGTMTQVEVITSVQRRRRWSAADKQQMVAESAMPGRTVSSVARRHGIAPQQLFTWRRELLAAATGIADGGFLAIAVSEPPAVVPDDSGRIEIVLPTGVMVRVGPEVATDFQLPTRSAGHSNPERKGLALVESSVILSMAPNRSRGLNDQSYTPADMGKRGDRGRPTSR